MSVHFGDCRQSMREMIAEGVRVELCVTSPPYDDLRTYGGHTWDFEGTALALYDILVDGGIACWNVGDSVVDGSETLTSAKQKIFFREQCGFRIHDTMIYEKINFANPERVRYHQLFEYVFVLTKGAPRCFNPIRDKENVSFGRGPLGLKKTRQPDGTMKADPCGRVSPEWGMRGNVWRGPTSAQEDVCNTIGHPATMPLWLARDLIESWSNPGDTVLDPFFGSGTTGEAAERLGRKWLGIEINRAYEPLINDRTAQAGMVFA